LGTTLRTASSLSGLALMAPERRPRVMYLLADYPALSETYVRVEIDAVRRDHDVAIVATMEPPVTYEGHHPYVVERDVARTCELVEEFRPDVLHSHWLVEARRVRAVARRTGVPFTVRTHSFDTQWTGWRNTALRAPGGLGRRAAPDQFRVGADATRDDLCIGVIGFPFVQHRLARLGVQESKLRPCPPVVDVDRFLDRSPNGDGVMGCGPVQHKRTLADFFAIAAGAGDRPVRLYAIDSIEKSAEALAREHPEAGGRVELTPPVDHTEMPREYKRHEWFVRTGDPRRRRMGWPASIAEAQASGVGVCIADMGPDLDDYVGPAGFRYRSVAEARDIVSRPFPEELRELGFEHAQQSDVNRHLHVLTDLWEPAFTETAIPTRQP
jgi:hypothetical protein